MHFSLQAVISCEHSDVLKECGYQQRGNEVMYNGHTGRKVNNQVQRFNIFSHCLPPPDLFRPNVLPAVEAHGRR